MGGGTEVNEVAWAVAKRVKGRKGIGMWPSKLAMGR